MQADLLERRTAIFARKFQLLLMIFSTFLSIIIYIIYRLLDFKLETDLFFILILSPIGTTFLIITTGKLVSFLNSNEYKDSKFSLTEPYRKNILNDDDINFEDIDLLTFKKRIANSLETQKIDKLDIKLLDILVPITTNIKIYLGIIQRNSIVNLLIGIFGSCIAIITLLISVLYAYPYTSLQLFFIATFPKLTFVVFIQVFAFFFLRLYKNNLEDAKYFQNELSNLTAKVASIKIALLTNNNELINFLLKDLSTIERNFKLYKDETLHNLENKKIEKEVDQNMIDLLKDLVSKIETKK